MKYYKVEDVQSLIAACKWRMTLAKEQGGVGFVEYDKTIIDVDEFQKRLSTLELVETSEDCIDRYSALAELDPRSYEYKAVKELSSIIPKRSCYRCGLREDCEDSVKREPKEGEWIEHKERTIVKNGNFIDFFPTEYECSNCGLRQATYFINSSLLNYCPNCGTKMKGIKE